MLRFQIWIHLDILELFEKLQKYHPKLKIVDFENHDILSYLFFDLMPYLCSPFYADIKSDIRFDNSFHVKLYQFGTKIYGMINMEAIPKFDIKSVIKSDIKFDISTKLTTWIGH